MNFRKWELFLAHSILCYFSCYCYSRRRDRGRDSDRDRDRRKRRRESDEDDDRGKSKEEPFILGLCQNCTDFILTS